MSTKLFGDFFKSKRIALGKTLRNFCAEHDLDPGNISKLERGLISPPVSSEKLEQYAGCLGIKKGTDDWFNFFDLANVCAGRIPDEIQSDEELLSKMPLVFRTLRGQKLTSEQLDLLIEKLRKV